VQTPRFWGQASRAGALFLLLTGSRGLRISWLIVGIERPLALIAPMHVNSDHPSGHHGKTNKRHRLFNEKPLAFALAEDHVAAVLPVQTVYQSLERGGVSVAKLARLKGSGRLTCPTSVEVTRL
jgi:hypothetical protein